MRLAIILAAASLASPLLAAEPWELITSIGYEESEADGEWKVTKTIPDALRTQADSFTITGYYVPVEAQAYVSQFLIVPDPADCPFCGSNGYGPTLEVHVTTPMPDLAEASEVTVSGKLNFDESTETYRAVYLTDATLLGTN